MFSSIAGLGLVGDLKFRLILWDCVVDVLTCWVFLSLTGKEEVCVGSFFLGAEKTMRNSNCSNTSVKFTRDHLTKPFHHWMYFLSYIKIAYNGICYLFLLYKFYARKKKKTYSSNYLRNTAFLLSQALCVHQLKSNNMIIKACSLIDLI